MGMSTGRSLVLGITLALLLVVPLTKGGLVGAEESPSTEKAIATIVSKQRDPFVTELENGGRTEWMYAVFTREQRLSWTEDTRLYAPNGQDMSIDELPVPCEAEIEYLPLPQGSANAVLVKVKKIGPGAKRDWAKPLPE